RGTTIGNILFRRYFSNTKWLTNPMSDEKQRERDALKALFEKYGKQYQFDWLLLAAQGYQESAFDPAPRSDAGAVGLMQLLPSTAREMGADTDKLTDPETNIRAGTMYLAKLRDTYFNDPALSPAARSDFLLAAYNAGPGNVRKWRDLATKRGMDANL